MFAQLLVWNALTLGVLAAPSMTPAVVVSQVAPATTAARRAKIKQRIRAIRL